MFKYFKKIKSLYELDRNTYFNSFLREEDKTPFEKFTSNLHNSLDCDGLDCVILAVGSSTFPKEHWEKRKKLNLLYRSEYDSKLSEEYRDIDIKLIPKKKIPVKRLKNSTIQLLK